MTDTRIGGRSRGRTARIAGVALCTAALTSAVAALADTSELNPHGCIDETDGGPDLCAQDAEGLSSAVAVAVSPDGKSVYSAAFIDDAIARFDRRASGALVPRGCIDDNDSGFDDCAKSAAGLDVVDSVGVSPDGTSVYAASEGDDAIVRFERNTNTGAIAPAGCVDDNDSGVDTCARSGDGLEDAWGPAVSRDGSSVYVASREDDAIVHFKRKQSGKLVWKGCVDDNDSGPDSCAQSTDGLDGAQSVAVSPDGTSVYVASSEDDAIVRFERNTDTGALTPVECRDDNDTGPDDCVLNADGLGVPRAVAVSRDGASVYVASSGDNAIVHFKRKKSGALVWIGCADDNDLGPDSCTQSTDGLGGARWVTASADGKSVYAAGALDDALVRFSRNPTTGALVALGCVDDNDSGPDNCAQGTDGLDGPFSGAVSRDGTSVYIASAGDWAIARFARTRP